MALLANQITGRKISTNRSKAYFGANISFAYTTIFFDDIIDEWSNCTSNWFTCKCNWLISWWECKCQDRVSMLVRKIGIKPNAYECFQIISVALANQKRSMDSWANQSASWTNQLENLPKNSTTNQTRVQHFLKKYKNYFWFCLRSIF